MSRDERIEFIRAGGDPRISVRIVARDADAPTGRAQPSRSRGEHLKERIRSFGFRTWSDEAGARQRSQGAPDFAVTGEVAIKRLSMRLEASGLVVTKFALTSGR